MHETVFGRGYATFTMRREGLELELTVFVPPSQPAEIRLLTIRNRTPGETALPRRAVCRDGAGRELRATPGAACVVRTDFFAGPIYFANPRNDFRQGWAFVVTTLAVEAQEHVRDRFIGDAARDLSRPCFVEHGVADESAGDDGRRIASFAGIVEVPAHGEPRWRWLWVR